MRWDLLRELYSLRKSRKEPSDHCSIKQHLACFYRLEYIDKRIN